MAETSKLNPALLLKTALQPQIQEYRNIKKTYGDKAAPPDPIAEKIYKTSQIIAASFPEYAEIIEFLGFTFGWMAEKEKKIRREAEKIFIEIGKL